MNQTKILKSLPLEKVVTQLINAQLQTENVWHTPEVTISILPNHKWSMTNNVTKATKEGDGSLSLVENWLDNKVQLPNISEEDVNVFSSNYHIGLGLLQKTFHSEIEALTLTNIDTITKNQLLDDHLTRIQLESLEKQYEREHDIEYEEPDHIDYEDEYNNDGHYIYDNGSDQPDNIDNNDFSEKANSQLRDKKLHILKLLKDIDPQLLSKISENLDVLVTMTVQQTIASIDDYSERNREYFDEWATGLGIAQDIIKDNFLPASNTKKNKMK